MSDLDLQSEKSREIDRWMMAMTVAIVVGYAWLTSIILEPALRVPTGAVSSLSWIDGGAVKDWRGIRRTRSLALAYVARELNAAESEIAILGGFDETPSLTIFADDSNRYVVSDTKIEMAESIAIARGQLRKALIKSWFLQRQPQTLAARSLLRLEVASDALGAMLSSDAKFESSKGDTLVELPKPAPWIRFAGSLDFLCGSPWASLDLQGRCGNSKRVHQLSFRPLLAGMIWAVYREAPLFRRFDLARAWALELRSITNDDGRREKTPARLTEWKDWLALEYREIFPVEKIALRAGFSEDERKALINASRRVEDAVELFSESSTVSFVFQSDRAFRDSASGAMPSSLVDVAKSFIVIDETHGSRLFPGDVILDEAELRGFSTPLLVRENCGDAKLGALLGSPIAASRYLYVRSCRFEGRLSSWARLARRGLGGFAEARPEAEFIQIHRESAELAIRMGVLSTKTDLSLLMNDRERISSLLGLDRPEWRREIGAYRVLGSIEAVEWYRRVTRSSGRAL